jgi:predicted nucleic acid-binding protein
VILVDSSVWIDYLRGSDTPQARTLDSLLGRTPLAIGDLILTEVLQGCASERQAAEVERLFASLTLLTLGGREVALEAARNFRRLRGRGVTVRKTIDGVIATHCILGGHTLLHRDRDFDAYEAHLGLLCLAC